MPRMVPEVELKSVMPDPRPAMISNMIMGEVIRVDTQSDRDALDRMCGRTPGQFQWLGRFVLPPFQRPPVWDRTRQIRFVESAWLGYDIGRYTIVDTWGSMTKWTLCLIDGQQRIRAIMAYLNDEFEVFDHLWSGLPLIDHRRFSNIVFPRCSIRDELSEEELRDLYNRLNYGGVAHTEDQRA